MGTRFRFDSEGMGDLLRRHRLSVPPNQRSYAWRDPHVEDLLQDLNGAIQEDADEYFVGTIVLVESDSDSRQIADGQQRLATTTIILARIRDRLLELGKEGSARSVETNYLGETDIDTEEQVPRLRLNAEDHQFFADTILPRPDDVIESSAELRGSRKRLQAASQSVTTFLDQVLHTIPESKRAEWLVRLVKFIKSKASVVVVTVPDEVGAFRMFETLNDRGLRASQADILKNYLFSRAQNRVLEAQSLWTAMNGTIEILGEDDDDDGLVTYLRHFWITENGTTREKQLAERIKGKIGGETQAIRVLTDANDASSDYVALFTARHHQKWDTCPSARDHLVTISEHLRVEQIVPLLFSIARRFDPEEAAKAYRLCVSWSVRFLIYGGRGGTLDRHYSERAHEIGGRRITKARELRSAMSEIVPSNREFETAFAVARVSKTYLARYYLRALDKTLKEDPQPEFVANEDKNTISLEHVMPMTPGPGWDIDPDTAETSKKLLGNMVLMPAKKNARLGNAAFPIKRSAYEESAYEITREVSQYEDWTSATIRQRQAAMATVAVRTWPLTFE